MADYFLLSAGIAVMIFGDLKITKSGHRGWFHLDEDEKTVFGQYPDMPIGQELILSLQLWLPVFGILVFVLLFKATADAVIDFGVPDLFLALSYVGLLAVLLFCPVGLLGRAVTEHARRASFRSADPGGRAIGEDGRRRAERFWRSAIIVAHLMTAAGLISIIGLPRLAGIPVALIMLKKWFDHRVRYLERCKSAATTALRLREAARSAESAAGDA